MSHDRTPSLRAGKKKPNRWSRLAAWLRQYLPLLVQLLLAITSLLRACHDCWEDVRDYLHHD